MKEYHNSLTGRERLYNVVQCLSKSCPWTMTVNANQMISWLQSELQELQTELEKKGRSSLMPSNKLVESRDALVSELGDVLFNSLMLEMMLRR